MSLTSASFNAKLPAPSVDFAPFSYQGDTYQTWYTVYGNLGTAATPLVVLHGGPGFTHEYMLAMADISAHSIPVILYDQIGNGRSSHIHDKPDTFWTIDLFIDELENLLKHLKIERKFDLYGHSWGGMMASEFSVRRQPAGLRHLVLANSLTTMALWNRSFSERLAAMPKDVQEKIAAGPSNLAPFLEGMLALYAEYGCRTKPIRPELLDTLSWVYGNEGEEGDRTAGKGMSGEIKDWSITDRLHQINVPTLVINGRYDLAQDYVVEDFSRLIPNVEWVTFDKSSHTPHWEERDRLMTLVQKFLAA